MASNSNCRYLAANLEATMTKAPFTKQEFLYDVW